MRTGRLAKALTDEPGAGHGIKHIACENEGAWTRRCSFLLDRGQANKLFGSCKDALDVQVDGRIQVLGGKRKGVRGRCESNKRCFDTIMRVSEVGSRLLSSLDYRERSEPLKTTTSGPPSFSFTWEKMVDMLLGVERSAGICRSLINEDEGVAGFRETVAIA